MTNEQTQSGTMTEASAITPRASAEDAVVGNVDSGRKVPVILFSILWVAWIAFLVWMLVI